MQARNEKNWRQTLATYGAAIGGGIGVGAGPSITFLGSWQLFGGVGVLQHKYVKVTAATALAGTVIGYTAGIMFGFFADRFKRQETISASTDNEKSPLTKTR